VRFGVREKPGPLWRRLLGGLNVTAPKTWQAHNESASFLIGQICLISFTASHPANWPLVRLEMSRQRPICETGLAFDTMRQRMLCKSTGVKI
jgi:hypothetical protein